jgi:hypothetical protein
MNNDIIFAEEVCEHFRICRQTLKLWLAKSRAGLSDFPLPISPFRSKLRWRREDIVNYQSYIGNERAVPEALSPARRNARQAMVMQELRELKLKKQ